MRRKGRGGAIVPSRIREVVRGDGAGGRERQCSHLRPARRPLAVAPFLDGLGRAAFAFRKMRQHFGRELSRGAGVQPHPMIELHESPPWPKLPHFGGVGQGALTAKWGATS